MNFLEAFTCKKQQEYTGRVICIVTDAHAMDVPLEAALKDAKNKGATEFYSLGDNIGDGPCPRETLEILKKYNVISIAGNAEEYIRLGIESFPYIYGLRINSENWTKNQLTKDQIGEIQLYPNFIDLVVGGKNIALCHFANDVRFDFNKNSTWSYQNNIEYNDRGYNQFLYTNSKEQLEYIAKMKNKYGISNEMMKGILSAERKPLFNGKTVEMYDAIFQGHIHFRITEETDKTKYYTVRAVGMGNVYTKCQNSKRNYKEPRDMASYILLKEKSNNQGFDVEEVLVKFDWDSMAYKILTSEIPFSKMEKFASITEQDKERLKRR